MSLVSVLRCLVAGLPPPKMMRDGFSSKFFTARSMVFSVRRPSAARRVDLLVEIFRRRLDGADRIRHIAFAFGATDQVVDAGHDAVDFAGIAGECFGEGLEIVDGLGQRDLNSLPALR